MARRAGRKGSYLATDDYTGFTCYASELRKDYWGAYSRTPLKRNLQEIAQPLDDPYPVPFTRGPSYETSIPCDYEVAPAFVGLTTVRTNPNNAGFQALRLDPGVGDMIVGCTLVVR